MMRLGCTLGIIGLFVPSTACSSTTETWAFDLPAGESWSSETEGGDLEIHNDGPGTIDIEVEDAEEWNESPIASGKLEMTVVGDGDASVSDMKPGSLRIRNESDKKTRVHVRIDRD